MTHFLKVFLLTFVVVVDTPDTWRKKNLSLLINYSESSLFPMYSFCLPCKTLRSCTVCLLPLSTYSFAFSNMQSVQHVWYISLCVYMWTCTCVQVFVLWFYKLNQCFLSCLMLFLKTYLFTKNACHIYQCYSIPLKFIFFWLYHTFHSMH